MAVAKERMGRLLVRQLPTNTDLVGSIKKACADNGIRYGAILSTVGSVRQVKMEGVVVSSKTGSGTDFGPPRIIPGPLQVLGLEGVIYDSEKGEMDAHVHGTFVNTAGEIFGGHVMEGDSTIATRLVIVIGEVADVTLTERYDKKSGHQILHVEPLKK